MTISEELIDKLIDAAQEVGRWQQRIEEEEEGEGWFALNNAEKSQTEAKKELEKAIAELGRGRIS